MVYLDDSRSCLDISNNKSLYLAYGWTNMLEVFSSPIKYRSQVRWLYCSFCTFWSCVSVSVIGWFSPLMHCVCSTLTLESRRSMLSKLLLRWMRPLMRRSDGLPWMVLTEEAAVTEPAVGLGCILKSTRREHEEEEDKEKPQQYIRASQCTPSTEGQSATGKTEEE